MKRARQTQNDRPGGIAPLTCVLLVFMLAMVAFAVDISWIALSQSQLQNCADAAALAGANKLGDNFVLHNMPTQTTANKTALRAAAVSAAQTAAKQYAGYNPAGGASLTLLDSDIDVGFTDASGTFTSYAVNANNYPNTVKVTMRRDESANAPLNMFFAPALGMSTVNLVAPATAVLYSGAINGLNVGSVNSGVLPLTFDVNDWNNFIAAGKDANGKINKDSSDNPLLQVWASTWQDTGNFGLLSLNDSHVGSNTIDSWIHDGVPPSDIQILENKNLIPLSAHNPLLWDWQGNTGFKAANAMDVNEYAGKTFILPLFKPLTPAPAYSPGLGQGSNYYYNIVEFVGVTIMSSSKSNSEVWIQPAPVSDPNMILSNVVIAGTSSSFATAFTVKLTN